VQIQWDADLDPDETLSPELHSTETWNAGKWVNKDFDRAVELAREEHDFKKRKKAYEDPPQVREGLPDDPPGSSTCTGSGSIGRDSGLRRE
jgi:ABC-type transport system substrate-binding protein